MLYFIDIHLLIRGLLIGFIIAIPIGPIGVLCLRRTFQYGRLSGLFSGLGAVTIDIIYAAIAIFGLTFVSNIMMQYRSPLHIFGFFLLTFLGWKIFFDKPHGKNLSLNHKGLGRDYVSILVLTLAQPGALLALFGIFSTIAPSVAGNYRAAIFVLLGTLIGELLTLILVTYAASYFHTKVSAQSFMYWVNRIAGTVIWLFAVILAIDFFLHLK